MADLQLRNLFFLGGFSTPGAVFLNIYGAQESIPSNRFRQPGGPVRKLYSYSVPIPPQIVQKFQHWFLFLVFGSQSFFKIYISENESTKYKVHVR